MGKVLSANRVAAVSTFLAALAGLVAAFVGVFPSGWQNFALAAVALLTKAVTALKFLDGSQKWDQIVGVADSVGQDITEKDIGPEEQDAPPRTVVPNESIGSTTQTISTVAS